MPRWSFILVAASAAITSTYNAHRFSQLFAAAANNNQDELSVSEFASRLAVTADAATLATWKSEVDTNLHAFRTQIKNSYPVPCSRKSLHPGARFYLRGRPEKVFRYNGKPSSSLFDFASTTDSTKVMIKAEDLVQDVSVLEDPLRDAFAMARRAEGLMESLRSSSSKLRADVDQMASKSGLTFQMLKKGVAAEGLKELATYEAEATAELEAAKELVEELHGADAAAVKQTTQAGRLLSEARICISSMGAEANSVKKDLRRLEVQFAHFVSSSGVEMRSSVDYMNRAKIALAALTTVYQEGMSELKQQKEILENVEAAEETGRRIEREVTRLQNSNDAIHKITLAAKTAQDTGDILTLQGLLTQLYEEKNKMRKAMTDGRFLVAEMNVKSQALDSTLDVVASNSLKANGEVMSQRLTQQRLAMLDSLKEEGERGDLALSAATREIAEGLARHLEAYGKAVKDSEEWLKQASSRHHKLMTAVQAKEKEANAAQQAADQFYQRLVDDIAVVQAEVSAGATDWNTIEEQYSLESHSEDSNELMQQAAAANKALVDAAVAAQKTTGAFNLKAEQLLYTLASLEKMANDLAERARDHQEWLQNQKATGKDAIVAVTEAASACHRAEAATELANSSAGLSQAVKDQVSKLKNAMRWMAVSASPRLALQTGKAEGSKELKVAMWDLLRKHIDMATGEMHLSDRHLGNASNMKAKLEGIKEVLSKDIETLKAALSADSLDSSIKQVPSQLLNTGTGASQDGESGEEQTGVAPRVPGGSEEGRLERLASTVELHVGYVLFLANKLKEERDAAANAQRRALQAAANLRLARLKAGLTDGGDDAQGADNQDLLTKADTLPRKINKRVLQQVDELEEFQTLEGDMAALANGVLQELVNVLALAETRLSDMIKTGVPELESHMASAQSAAKRLYPERSAAAAAGEVSDPKSAAAVDFHFCEQRARQLAETLHVLTKDVEACASHVKNTLNDLDSFEKQKPLQNRAAPPAPNDTSANTAADPGMPQLKSFLVVRRLSATSGTPTVDQLLKQAGDLATKAGQAGNDLLGRLAHLDALKKGGQPPLALPPALYLQNLPQQPKTLDPIPSHSSPPAGSTPKKNDDDGKKADSSKTVGMAVGIPVGILLLLALALCFFCAYKKRAKRLRNLKQTPAASMERQYTDGGVHNEPPFVSPTLDFDDFPEKGHVKDSFNIGQDTLEQLHGELSGIRVMGSTDVQMGDLEIGKTDTTKRQYFVDEHHLVAKQLSSSQPPRCPTPLAYGFSLTPTAMQSPRVTTPGPRTPRRMEDQQGRAPQRGRSSSPTKYQQYQQRQEQRQQQRRQHKNEVSTKAAQDLEDLHAQVEIELQSHSQPGPTSGA